VPGVAMATSGPGATNLLTGIGSCYFDSVPAVFITGQVNQHEQKGVRSIRQLGFQETDIASMAAPITKQVYKVESAQDLPEIFESAFKTAMSGRPGPVLIDIPMNIQRAEVMIDSISLVEPEYPEAEELSAELFEELYQAIRYSSQPLILAGRGVMSSFSRNLLIKFAEVTGIPVITSLLAVDVIPYNHPLRVGFIGAYGNRWANLAIGECDLMIVVGSRLDIRQTGADTKGFKGDKTIYHIDIEEAEINNRVESCVPVKCDIKTFLSTANEVFKNKTFLSFSAWRQSIAKLKAEWPDNKEIKNIKGINPNGFINHLSTASVKAAAFLADVGSHQMWSAQSLQLKEKQYFFTSGGMGAMGFALPAAIGTCIGANLQPVVMISGDGGFQLNIQELQTIVRNKLPIKMVVLNNLSLGMIRQFQDSYFDSKYQSTMWGYSVPDFEKVANAYGIKATTINEEASVSQALEDMWSNSDEPYLLQVMIDPFANAYPKIAFGKPITEMEPFSKPIEMEGT
jgi:acetolactate synthase I/II/III large subunit